MLVITQATSGRRAARSCSKLNYRGSAGYGEKFRKLNMRNLGVGDAWDVLSGIDYLIDEGWVDKRRSLAWVGARAATSRLS